jgi:tagatose 6-phosphate kinase
MILCVNPNAAIDKTVVVRDFRLNEIHRPEQVTAFAGGKGCNVARGLRNLGETPVVTGWIGGTAGDFIENGLRNEGIQTAFIRTNFESRTCLSVVDPASNQVTEIYEKGEVVPEAKVVEFLDFFKREIDKYRAVTFSGSLPPEVPADFYGWCIQMAKEAGVPAFLDSSGLALKHGLQLGQPALIKPNRHEYLELIGADLRTLDDFVQSARKTAGEYGTVVVLSFGSEGAIAADANRVLVARPPAVEFKSAVGSGDCMLAGLAFGLTHQLSLSESLRTAVAAGTANTLSVGAGQFKMDDYEKILNEVDVRPLA